jgi:hypothetical protein
MVTGNMGQQWRHQQGSRSGAQADPHVPDLAVLEQFSASPQFAGLEHDAPSPLHRQLTQWRQRIAFANAVEQGTAQFFLQRLDAAAQRGLREVRADCGAAERAAVRERKQVFHLSEVHQRPIMSFENNNQTNNTLDT